MKTNTNVSSQRCRIKRVHLQRHIDYELEKFMESKGEPELSLSLITSQHNNYHINMYFMEYHEQNIIIFHLNAVKIPRRAFYGSKHENIML